MALVIIIVLLDILALWLLLNPIKIMREINLIVVHCSATPEGKDYHVEDIRQMHIQRGFSDIGYHYLVPLDGDIEVGRKVDKIGAHAKGYNANSIGVCYVGGVDANYIPKDTRTEAQKEALICLIKDLKKAYPNARVCGHRDLSPDLNNNGKVDKFEWIKVCPCYNPIEEYLHIS